jgi:UDP-glucose 4-epimerase
MKHLDWQGMRVLVTGARGFIGTQLCRRLVAAGAIVHGVSRTPSATSNSKMRFWRGDVTLPAELRRVFDETAPDTVFHLAGRVTGSQNLAEVLPTLEVNLTSTVNLLTVAAERRRCRVVLAGSMQEPDGQHGGTTPSSPYAASKWACSAYASMFHALYQLPVVIARPMLVYGPGQRQESKLLPLIIRSLLRGDAPRLTSGTRLIDWVFIDDVVSGLMAVAISSDVEGLTIDLGSGRLTSIRDIVDEIRSIIGYGVAPAFGAVPDRPFEFPCVARVAETQRLTGWTATTSLREGLMRTIEWHRRVIADERRGVTTGTSHA